MKIARSVSSVERKDNYFSIVTNCVELRVWFLTDDIVRIRAGFDGDFIEASYSLVLTAWDDAMDDFLGAYRRRITPAAATLIDAETQAVLQGTKLRVVIDKEPFRIRVYDQDGDVIHEDIADLAYQEDQNHRRIHTSRISQDDCFFGFGEKSGEWNKAQAFMTMNPTDAMGYDPRETDSLYKHIPFYIRLGRQSRKAVGYFYHNTAECDFNMGREKSNYWPMYSSYRTNAGDIDLFLIQGASIRDVVRRYTDLTGKSTMLPRTAMGYLGSSMYYSELRKDCDDAIAEFIQTAQEEDFPIDGFQLSSGYCSQETPAGLKRCVFTWNGERFKAPEDFFVKMNAQGIAVAPNVKPGVLLVHPRLEEMKQKDMFVMDSEKDEPGVGTWWGGPGLFVDFTKSAARTAWKEMLIESVLKKGTSSVWNDNCEYDSLTDKDCRCDFEGIGTNIGRVKAAMPNIMCQVTEEAISEVSPNRRPFIVCRSGHAGIQRYAQTWSGDNLTSWDTLKYNIATMLGMSLSGVANQGSDVGGFHGGAPEPELLVRWVQSGVFYPRFSVHSTNTDNTVTELWMYPAYTSYIRDAVKLRYRLIPYLYSLMARAHESGLPIVEPMCSAFQQDACCYDEGVNFMVGDSLLVASVVEKGASIRRVYLPEGEVFYDLSTRERYEGGQTVELLVDVGSIPMFIRGGGIVPMATDQLYNLATQDVTSLSLLCAPDKDCDFCLYEDDGDTLEYRRGVYCKTHIALRSGVHTSLGFTRDGAYPTQVENIRLDVVSREKSPYWVTLNGRMLKHFLHDAKFEANEEGWYYDQQRRSTQIKYKNIRNDHQVVISFDEFDMIGM